jgi:glycosyltransferase involved in cell wall biosynthesis
VKHVGRERSYRPRVVLATRIFSPEPAAASFRLAALCNALDTAGARVTVLTVRDRDAGRASTRPGIQVRRWPVLRDRAGYVRGYLPYLSFDVPLALRLLAQPADVVVCEPPPTTGLVVRIISALRRTPYVYYAADIWSDAAQAASMPKVVVRLLRALEALAMRGAASVVAISDAVAERLRELGVDRVTTVRNGVDTNVFSPDGSGGDERRPYLVYAGTVSEWQGAEVFVRAMPRVLEQVPDAKVIFLGQGSSWELLRAEVNALPAGAVEMRGLVPAEEAARWQRGARAALVSILPGRGYDLAYPTKIFAALACGTPVVYAGPGPAAVDIARESLGWVVEHDASAVADAMVAALRAEPRRENVDHRVLWVRANASAAVSARRVADIVLAVASADGHGSVPGNGSGQR